MHLFGHGAGSTAPFYFCGDVTLQTGADSDSSGGDSGDNCSSAGSLAPAGPSLRSLKRLSLRFQNARRARGSSRLALDQREQMLPGC
jgi:hypothetical protein